MMMLGLALVSVLARGPITVMGHYVGIHFLALGCLLTLTGFNVVHLGVLAKVIASSQLPHLSSRIQRWALKEFTLEGGLIVGLVLIAGGTVVDSYILWKWLSSAAAHRSRRFIPLSLPRC